MRTFMKKMKTNKDVRSTARRLFVHDQNRLHVIETKFVCASRSRHSTFLVQQIVNPLLLPALIFRGFRLLLFPLPEERIDLHQLLTHQMLHLLRPQLMKSMKRRLQQDPLAPPPFFCEGVNLPQGLAYGQSAPLRLLCINKKTDSK